MFVEATLSRDLLFSFFFFFLNFDLGRVEAVSTSCDPSSLARELIFDPPA